MPPQRVCIGRLSRPHGLRGEIKAFLEVDDLETVRALQCVEVEGLPYRLMSVRVQNNAYLLSLEGVTTREAAQNLAGRDIWIDPAQLPPLPAGEYYQFEVIGLAVYVAESLTWIGNVTAILPTPAHDIYVIQGAGKEYLVPAVAAAIVSLEPENGRLLIDAAYLTVANGVH
jgi:16S rRNA processing protein RimM